MRIMNRMHTMYKRFKSIIEYQVLIRFLLTTELIYLSIILIFMCCDELDGNGFLQYYNLHNEGYKTITVLGHFEEDKDVFTIKYNKNVEITIHRLNCSVMIDGKEYLFKADAADVIGQNSGKESRVYAAERREVGGYIYSSTDRRDIFFSNNTDDKWKLFARKAVQCFEFRYKSQVLYKVYIYFIMIIVILAKFKKSNEKSVLDIVLDKVFESKIYDDYLSRKWKIRERKVPVISKENYSNKAIKQNPEYELLENEEIKFRYTPEMIAALKSIKSGDYKISSKQRETIKEAVKKWKGNLKLRGPILANNAIGHEAVLLNKSWKIFFSQKCWAKVIERTEEGDFAERRFKIDYSLVRNISGNHVIVVKSGAEIGIYENAIKNNMYPMVQDMDILMKRVNCSKWIYSFEQFVLIIIPVTLVVLTWKCTRNWFAFPEVALCFVVAGTYKYINYKLELKYISKYGKTIYENNFCKLWKGWYVLLIIFAVCITI